MISCQLVIRGFIICGLLVIAVGCSKTLNTEFGTLNQKSINGFQTLYGWFTDTYKADRRVFIPPNLDPYQLIVIAERISSTPEERIQAWDMLAEWLGEEAGRVVVVLQRDGNRTEISCDMMLAEYRQQLYELNSLDVDDNERKEARAELEAAELEINEILLDESLWGDENLWNDDSWSESWANHQWIPTEPELLLGEYYYGNVDDHVIGMIEFPIEQTKVTRLAGPWSLYFNQLDRSSDLGKVVGEQTFPWEWQSRVGLRLPYESAQRGDWQSLLVANNSHTIAAGLQIESSNFIVCTSSEFLLDAAGIFPEARALTTGMLQDISTRVDPNSAALWVESISTIAHEDVQNPMITQLFSTPPISWISWHVLVALLLFAWWKMRWLGRPISTRQGKGLEREDSGFASHIETLAGYLRFHQDHRRALKSIARYTQQDLPERLPENDDIDQQDQQYEQIVLEMIKRNTRK